MAGGRLFSDPLARMVFILFVLLSTPVGFHHQFADPGISASWKLAHTVTTYAILYPSFVTAFTVIASLEVAGRLKGAKGLFNWIGRLPWADPFFASIALAMLGVHVRRLRRRDQRGLRDELDGAQHGVDQGHFHVTLGTTVALSFMGATYWLLPRMLGRELRLMGLARVQPYLWFLGHGALQHQLSHRRAARPAAARLQRGAHRRVRRAVARADRGRGGRRRHPLRERAVVCRRRRGDVESAASRFRRRPFEFAVPLRPAARQRLGSLRAVDGRGHRAWWRWPTRIR